MGEEVEVWERERETFVVQSGTTIFVLSNKIGPFINPLKSMINSAYSYSCKSKYEHLTYKGDQSNQPLQLTSNNVF